MRSTLQKSVFSILGAAVIFSLVGIASAQTTGTTPAACDQLFNLPQGTIATPASSAYLNQDTCGAYQFLISRYSPGNCSTVGFTNAKVQGITSLNSDFALRLAKMLQAASTAGFNITINSAFRSVQGEQCANPRGFGGNSSQSMHTKGLAADLQYPNDPNSAKGCDSGSVSPAYQWVAANAKNFGLGLYDQLHSHVNGECNHVEASSAVQGGVGPGGGGAANPTTPSSPIVSAVEKLFGGGQQQPAAQSAPALTASQPMQQLQPTAAPITTSPASVLTTPAASTFSGSPALPSGQQLITPNTTTATSALQILESIANPIVATSSTIGTAAAIGLNGEDQIAQLEGSEPQVAATSSIADNQVAADQVQSTFTSPNLDQNNSYSYSSASTLQNLLQDLKVVLAQIVVYLQPFGGQIPSQNLSE